MRSHRQAIVELYLAVMILTPTGLFPKLIQGFSVMQITALRAIFACGMLFGIAYFLKEKTSTLSRQQLPGLLISGLLLATHWYFYFLSVQVSTVAIGMLALFTFPIMAALVEPWVFREKLSLRTIINAILVLLGISLMVGFNDIDQGVGLGVGLGLISAFLYTIRNVLSRKLLEKIHGVQAMGWQTLVTAIVLCPFLWTTNMSPDAMDWLWVVVLGLVITGVGHTLLIRSFQYFTVASASIIATLQPLFATILAWILLAERPHWTSAVGGAMILIAVIWESRQKQSKQRAHATTS